MSRLFATVVLIGVVVGASAQGLMQRKRPDIIPLDGQARRIGYYVAPGITYTLSRFQNEEQEVFRSGDTSYTATYDPAGRFGPYLEAGLSWYTRDPLIVDYLDLGVAYKDLSGREFVSGSHALADSITLLEHEGRFREQMITAHFNANKFIPTRNYQFVQLTLGANADFRLGNDYTHTADSLLNDHRFPEAPWAQLHFKVGYGFKVTGHLLIIPAIETPIFSVMPEDEGRFGALHWFSTDHRPLILSVRFLWLRARKGFDCPPPIRHNAYEKSKQYKPDSYHP
jgi:hypothetical protein